MNISKIASQTVNSVQSFTQNALPKLKKAVPTSDLPVSWCFQSMPYEIYMAKRDAYVDKLYETYFDTNGKVIPEIKEFLDETVFNMTIGGGRSERAVSSTIKNHISSSVHDIEKIDGMLYHGSLRPEMVLNEGFNPRRISRVNLGPGFYFASEGEAREYGTVIAAKIRESGAATARADDRFYEGVSSGEVAQKLSELLGFKNDASDEAMIQGNFVPKIINEYSRDFIINDLGIDVLRGYGGATPFDFCTCVLNPDIFESISRN